MMRIRATRKDGKILTKMTSVKSCASADCCPSGHLVNFTQGNADPSIEPADLGGVIARRKGDENGRVVMAGVEGEGADGRKDRGQRGGAAPTGIAGDRHPLVVVDCEDRLGADT